MWHLFWKRIYGFDIFVPLKGITRTCACIDFSMYTYLFFFIYIYIHIYFSIHTCNLYIGGYVNVWYVIHITLAHTIVSICVHTHTRIWMQSWLWTSLENKCFHLYTSKYPCTQECVHIYIHTSIHTIRIHIRTHGHMRIAYTRTYAYWYAYAHAYTHACTWIYAYSHTCTYESIKIITIHAKAYQ